MVISDLHYEKGYRRGIPELESYEWLNWIIDIHKPTTVIGLGDWGYGWTSDEWNDLNKKVPISAIYGNHDSLNVLSFVKDGVIREIEGLKFGFINGIISKRTSSDPFFVKRRSEEEFFNTGKILSNKNIDVLCTHESPRIEDLIKRGMHLNPGTIVVESLIYKLRPRLSLSGHFHLKEGWHMCKIGDTLSVIVDSSQAAKNYALIESSKPFKPLEGVVFFPPDGNYISVWHNEKSIKKATY